jgi:hypothetical protein
MKSFKGQTMQDYQHEYTTTLNGAPVTVVIDVKWFQDEDCKEGQWIAQFSLDSVWFDCTNVLPILDVNTQMSLEMEATRAIEDDQE